MVSTNCVCGRQFYSNNCPECGRPSDAFREAIGTAAAQADPQEPVFMLRGSDPLAAVLVGFWVLAKEKMGEDPAKIAEAEKCSYEMCEFAKAKGKDVKAASKAIGECIGEQVLKQFPAWPYTK